MATTTEFRTTEQQQVIDELSGDIASMFTEHGSFRTIDGFSSRSRIRISTYSFHEHGTLILNEDGSLWADCGEVRLVRAG